MSDADHAAHSLGGVLRVAAEISPVKKALPDTYDLAFVHTDMDLAQAAQGISTEGAHASAYLYNPPVPGKTAFGRFLAQHLEMPRLVCRASDILSKSVGEAEKHFARAFRQVANDGAILLIDEIDSFLHDRRSVMHGWEATRLTKCLRR
ncbi:AAA family ATPase [Burkholderia gladioli]|uniref:AAA family ATPase n=1 Tax=Burkholderia gladioli TaxID=28095 RepID=UPI003F7A2C09